MYNWALNILTNQSPDRIYLRSPSRNISFKDLLEIIEENKTFLSKSAISETRVLAIMDQSIKSITAFWLLWSLDNCVVPLSTSSTAKEIIALSEKVKSNWLFVPNVKKLPKENLENFVDGIFTLNSDFKFEIIKSPSKPSEKVKGCGALILKTSGTTAEPKLVEHSGEALFLNAKNHLLSLKRIPENYSLIVLPIVGAYTITAQIIGAAIDGSCIELSEAQVFYPKEIFKQIQKRKIKSVYLVPTQLKTLLNYRYLSKYKLDSLVQICIGGDFINEANNKSLKELLPNADIYNTYGLTEAGPRVLTNGYPINGLEVKVLEDGELCVKGDSVITEYFEAPEFCEQTICNGWLHTGDIAVIDKSGRIIIKGRIKNTIICGGYNIYPEEIEAVLNELLPKRSFIIKPKKDEMYGEIPVLQITKDNNPPITLSAVHSYLTNLLNPLKWPKEIQIVDEINKGETGKMIRK
ncbi:MAG: AMP-binding protein [Crocinitomix sp.]|nr:AMP-binding protein [Crocinitomix sp.]